MRQYHDLLEHILAAGTKKWQESIRQWVAVTSVFGYQMRFNLREWFPLLTTKKVFIKWIIHELLWFLQWDTNIQYLVKNGVHIRDERPYDAYQKAGSPLWVMTQEAFVDRIIQDDTFAKKRWDLWPVYGYQWRNFNSEWIDQIQQVIDTLKHNPHSRRNLVVAYNPVQAWSMLLPPCHSLFQFYVADWRLSCQLYQRSADVFLWVPFNIASYALLTMMIAQVTWLGLGDFVHTLGDAHIFDNHLDQVALQLSRTPRDLPTMHINPAVTDIFSFVYEDFDLQWYNPHPRIKAPIAV